MKFTYFLIAMLIYPDARQDKTYELLFHNQARCEAASKDLREVDSQVQDDRIVYSTDCMPCPPEGCKSPTGKAVNDVTRAEAL